MPPVGHNGRMMTPTDPARYAGADLRLAAVMLVPAIVLGCWFWGDPVCSRME